MRSKYAFSLVCWLLAASVLVLPLASPGTVQAATTRSLGSKPNKVGPPSAKSYTADIGTGAAGTFYVDLTGASNVRAFTVVVKNDHSDTVILDWSSDDTTPTAADITTAAGFPLLTGESITLSDLSVRYLLCRGETTSAPIRVLSLY